VAQTQAMAPSGTATTFADYAALPSAEAMLWSPLRAHAAPAGGPAAAEPPAFEPLQRLHGFDVQEASTAGNNKSNVSNS
jgi:hypothetical protein